VPPPGAPKPILEFACRAGIWPLVGVCAGGANPNADPYPAVPPCGRLPVPAGNAAFRPGTSVENGSGASSDAPTFDRNAGTAGIVLCGVAMTEPFDSGYATAIPVGYWGAAGCAGNWGTPGDRVGAPGCTNPEGL
jgi:hypothetical protein